MPQISQEFHDKLNALKARYDCSTESLDRTVAHNMSIGGAPESLHLQGKAADLIFDNYSDLLPAAQAAKELGFTGIEVDYRNLHLHVDLRTIPWQVVYTKERKYTFDEYLTYIRSGVNVNPTA